MLSPDELADVIGIAVDGALAPALARIAVLEARVSADGDGIKALAGLGERVAGLEARPMVPGPAGADGAPGANGADGIGFGDLTIEQLSDREFAVKAVAGDRVRELGRLVFPVVLDCGVWAAGRTYAKGDAVTFGGSLWIAQGATTARPESAEGARAWRLAVKRGRDGRTG